MKIAKKMFMYWIIIMFVITFTCSLTYLVTQQALRLGANEQPAQLAVDTALKLQNGKNPVSIVQGDTVDLSKSMDTFVMIYDHNKNLQASSGMINDIKPSYPKGVLANTSKKGEERVTWQPQNGLRFATVVLKYDNGYIVAGRSLHETENLIDTIGKLVLLAWAACLLFSTIALAIVYSFVKKYFKQS